MKKALLLVALLWSGCSQEMPAADDSKSAYIPPDVNIMVPDDGAWLSSGALMVQGDVVGLREVTVNGIDAVVTGSGYSAQLMLEGGVHQIEVRGIDGRGDARSASITVVAGEFEDPRDTMEDAVHVRVNERGLSYASHQVDAMVDPNAIASNAVGLVVYDDSYGILGWDAVQIAATITDLSLAPLETELSPKSGVMDLEVEIPGVMVSLQAVGEALGIDFDTEATAWAESVVVTGTLAVDAVGGDLRVELFDPRVDLQDFQYDTSLIPTGVEGYLFVDSISAFLEELAVEKIVDVVPGLLQESLSNLKLKVNDEFLGVPVTIGAQFAEASIDRDGIEMSLDVLLDIGDEDQHFGMGYLAAPDIVAELDRDADLTMAASDDLLNRVVYGLWRSGMFDMNLSSEDESLSPLVLSMLQAETGTVTTSAPLPPVVVSREDAFVVEIGGMVVDIATPGGVYGESLVLTVVADIPLSAVGRDGEIVLEMGEPEIQFSVKSSDWGAASTESITGLLTKMLSPEVVVALMGEMSFPIPSFGDMIQIDEVEVSAGGGDFHTHLDVSFN
jgi:hypothetical protein